MPDVAARKAAVEKGVPRRRPARAIQADPIDDMLGLALRLAQLRSFEAFYNAFADLDLRPGELIALVRIGSNPGIRQGVLGTALAIKRSNMVKLVAGLQARGLLERRAAPDDKRSVELTLTEAGRCLVADVLPRFRAHDRNLTQGALTAAQRADLIRMLRKVSRHAADGAAS